VSELEGGCLTCHRTLIAPLAPFESAFETTRVSPFDAPRLPQAATPVPLTPQDALNAPLLDLGQRLLAAPPLDEAAHSAAVAAYLQIYEAARGLDRTASPAEVGTLLGRLAVLERALLALENQANPVRLRGGSSAPDPAPVALASSAPPPLPILVAALALAVGMLIPPRRWSRLRDVHGVVVAFGVLFAAHRRGPPLRGAWLESVWSGRLPVVWGQSPFLSCESSWRS
jgi:hypothetical protein